MAQAAGCHESAICCGNLFKPASRLTSGKVRGVSQGPFVCVPGLSRLPGGGGDAEGHRGLGAGERRGAG